MQVACFLPEYEEEPQIRTVTAIPVGRENVEIEWMVGSYSEPWTVHKKGTREIRDMEGGDTSPSSIIFPLNLQGDVD